jgi:hypothetical protein
MVTSECQKALLHVNAIAGDYVSVTGESHTMIYINTFVVDLKLYAEH